MEKNRKILNKYYHAFILSIFILITIKLFIIGSKIQSKFTITNTLDFSWNVDIIERLNHGYIAGKDFVFTYGPLYQFISSIPSLIFGIPSFSSAILTPIILLIFSSFLLFVIFGFITKNIKNQIFLTMIFIFLLGLIPLVDANILLRVLVPLFFAQSFYNFVYIPKKNYINKFLILLLPAIFGTYIFDLFLTTFLITMLFFVFKLWTLRNKGGHAQYVKEALAAIFIVITSELLISYLISGNLNYLINSVTTISNYKYFMNIPISSNTNFIWLLFPLLLFGLIVWLIKTNNQIIKNKPLIVFCISSFTGLTAALIRTDDAHILLASLPSIISLLTLFYFLLNNKIRFFLLFLLILVPFSIKENYFETIDNKNIKNLSGLFKKEQNFFDFYKFPSDYYLSEKDFSYITSIIQNFPGDVMIYPYESYLLNIKNQTYNTFPLQFYDYSSSNIETEAVKRLSENPPKFIIYSVDNKGIKPLDNMPNLTRNPILNKWIINNYSVMSNRNKYLVLKHSIDKNAYQNKDCKLYSIVTKKINNNNFLENSIKPSTYYLNSDDYIHLPVKPGLNEILIFEDFSNASQMEDLFNSNINFNYYNVKKNLGLKIIKKYPIPIVTKVYDDFLIKCY